MVWLFGQVWVLCLLAFVLGGLTTWAVFVVPLRQSTRRPVTGHDWSPEASSEPVGWARPAETPEAEPADGPSPARTVDSALAALDSWIERRDRASRPAPGAAAAGALDLLGITGPPDRRPGASGAAPKESPGDATTAIPAQPGPPDLDRTTRPIPQQRREPPEEGPAGGGRPPR